MLRWTVVPSLLCAASWLGFYCQILNDSVVFSLTIYVNPSEFLWFGKGSEKKEMAPWVVRKYRFSQSVEISKPEASK